MKKYYICPSIITIVTALSLSVAQAADEKEHKHGKDDKHEHGQGHEPGKKTSVTIPDTSEALWGEIDKQHIALQNMVSTKNAAGLHEASEKLELLVGAVPAKHPDLAPDKKKRIEGQAKNVARLLDAIHEEGEEGKWDNVAKKVSQLDIALKIIRGQVGK